MKKISLYASALLVSTNIMAATLSVNSGTVLPYDYDSDSNGLEIVSGAILNYTATAHTAAGIFIDTINGNTNDNIGIWTDDIINRGTINVTDGGNNYQTRVFSIDAMASTRWLTNYGTITVDSAYDSYAIRGTVSGIINNDEGTITATLNGTLHEYGYALLLDGVGQVFNSGTINGAIDVNLNNFENRGKINLPTYSNGGYSYIKNFNQFEGTLQINVDSDNAGNATKYSRLIGNNLQISGGEIYVNVLNQNLLANQTLTGVISASSTLLVSNNVEINDNSALLDFRASQSGQTLDLQVVSASTIQDSVISGGGNSATQNAGRALTTIQNSGNTQMNSVFTSLNNLSSNQAVANAVETTTPQIANAASEATSQISRNISNIVNQRQNVYLGNGLNSGDMVFAEKSLWVKPFGSMGSQQDKDGLNGFDTKTYGLGLGIEGEYADNQKLGFALFYANANVDMNNISQDADLDVFSASVYGNVPVIDDKTQLLYQLGYSLQKTDSTRDISLTSQTATADYTSKSATADLRLVRDYQLNEKVLLQPMVSTTYRYFNSPSYSESGAGSLNLNVDKFSTDEFLVGLGSAAQYKIDDSSKLIGNVNLYYDLIDDNKTVTSSYSGASGVSFDTYGIDNGRLSHEIGLGYEREITTFSNINFSYNYQGKGTDYSDHLISAKYVLKF